MKKIKNIPQNIPLPSPVLPVKRGSAAVRWPEAVGVVSDKDIYQGGLFKKPGEDSYCLLGHAGFLKSPGCAFLRHEDGDHYAFSRAGDIVAQRILERVLALTYQTCNVPAANDKILPKALSARVWNATMCDFGYTEGNPEAAHITP